MLYYLFFQTSNKKRNFIIDIYSKFYTNKIAFLERKKLKFDNYLQS